MTTCPGVVAAAVFPVGDDPEHLRLYGAFVPSTSGPATEREVAEHCARRLPRSLLPHRIAVVTALPLLRTGKVDRAALQALFTDATAPSEGASAGSASGPTLTARLVELCGRALGAPCGAKANPSSHGAATP